MSIFDDIYSGNGWGFGSGHGSLPAVTKGYRQFLEMFLAENHIQTIVDYGCGDWQFSRLIDWGNAQYIGLDIVPSVVEANIKKYGNNRVDFRVIEAGTARLPKGDLLIVKDVLQHLSKEKVQAFVKDVLPQYRYALVTNCVIPTKDLNIDITDGEFRPLDLRQPPFNVQATAIYSFVGPKAFSKSERKFFPAWKKQVLLITSS